jgi:hypothetical protein
MIVGRDTTLGRDVAVSVDFSQFKERKCVFDAKKIKDKAPDSDFETWSPSDGLEQGCHLGQVVRSGFFLSGFFFFFFARGGFFS